MYTVYTVRFKIKFRKYVVRRLVRPACRYIIIYVRYMVYYVYYTIKQGRRR